MKKMFSAAELANVWTPEVAEDTESRTGCGCRRRRGLLPARGTAPSRGPRGELSEALTRIFVGAGRQASIAARDLVGAITGETGIPFADIGAIDIADRFALVEVPERLDTTIDALRATTIRGRKALVRRDQRVDFARR